MSTKRNILMMLSMVSGMASLLPANADQCISRSTTYMTPAQTLQLVPQPVVVPTTFMPSQTVKTTKTTVTTTTPLVEQPAVISTPDTISRRVIMTGSLPAASSSSTMTVAETAPFPVYGNRLAAMNEQIDRSVANGWMTAYQADNLRADSSRIAQMITNRSSVQSNIDAIERGLTGLNIEIQDAMRASGNTASIASPTY